LGNPHLPDALKAQKLGADILVLTGFDEGGTLPMKEIGSFNVLAEFVGKVDLPMMLAGGIADKKAVQTAFMLGAEGVWVGTAFIATHECRASQKVKDWIVQSTANDKIRPAWFWRGWQTFRLPVSNSSPVYCDKTRFAQNHLLIA
jgi:hypothetical protein